MPGRPLNGSPAALREHMASLRASVNRLRAERNEAVRARERERTAHRDTRRELARARDEAERLSTELERLRRELERLPASQVVATGHRFVLYVDSAEDERNVVARWLRAGLPLRVLEVRAREAEPEPDLSALDAELERDARARRTSPTGEQVGDGD